MAARFRDPVLMDILRRVFKHSSDIWLRCFLRLEYGPVLRDIRAHHQGSHAEVLSSRTPVFSKLHGHHLPVWNKPVSKRT